MSVAGILVLLIVLAIKLGVLALVYWLGTLLVALVPEPPRHIVATIWLVICVLVAILILLGVIGVVDISIGAYDKPLVR